MSTLDITLDTLTRVFGALLDPRSTDSISDIVLEGIEERYAYVKYAIIITLFLLIIILLIASTTSAYLLYNQVAVTEDIITDGYYEYSTMSPYNSVSMGKVTEIVEDTLTELKANGMGAVLLGFDINTIDKEYDFVHKSQNNELMHNLLQDKWLSYSSPSRQVYSSRNSSDTIYIDIFVDYSRYSALNKNLDYDKYEGFDSLAGLDMDLRNIDYNEGRNKIDELKDNVHDVIDKVDETIMYDILNTYDHTVYNGNGKYITVKVRLHLYKHNYSSDVYDYVKTLNADGSYTNRYGNTIHNVYPAKPLYKGSTIDVSGYQNIMNTKPNLLIYTGNTNNTNRLNVLRHNTKYNVIVYDDNTIFNEKSMELLRKHKNRITRMDDMSKQAIYALVMMYVHGGIHIDLNNFTTDIDDYLLREYEMIINEKYVGSRRGSYIAYDSIKYILSELNDTEKTDVNLHFNVKTLIEHVNINSSAVYYN
jgi:hypothetical protein